MGNRLTRLLQDIAGNVATSAMSKRFARVESAKRALNTRIATKKKYTLQWTLPTAGNVAKNAVLAKYAKVENAKLVKEERIVAEHALTLQRIQKAVVSAD